MLLGRRGEGYTFPVLSEKKGEKESTAKKERKEMLKDESQMSRGWHDRTISCQETLDVCRGRFIQVEENRKRNNLRPEVLACSHPSAPSKPRLWGSSEFDRTSTLESSVGREFLCLRLSFRRGDKLVKGYWNSKRKKEIMLRGWERRSKKDTNGGQSGTIARGIERGGV